MEFHLHIMPLHQIYNSSIMFSKCMSNVTCDALKYAASFQRNQKVMGAVFDYNQKLQENVE